MTSWPCTARSGSLVLPQPVNQFRKFLGLEVEPLLLLLQMQLSSLGLSYAAPAISKKRIYDGCTHMPHGDRWRRDVAAGVAGRPWCLPGVPAQIDGYAEVHVLSREVCEAAFDDPQCVVTVCPGKLRR